jgi:hypothetical protein
MAKEINMVKIHFGSTEKTTLLDEHGSTANTVTNYRAGTANLPVRTRYTIKAKVYNQQEEHTQYLTFSDELAKNRGLLDPEWKIEHTKYGDENGCYYVVKSYTVLSYE